MTENREVKSDVFAMLMMEKKYALQVYNAVNNTNYENPEDIQCIFRKNCASVPEERSAIPLQTEQSSAG